MKNVIGQKCSNKELKILGDFWVLAIVQALENGEKRFCEMQREIAKTSPTTLANRLKKLESLGLIVRQGSTEKLAVSYSLTDKGRGIIPILNEIRLFSDKFLE